MTKQLLRRDIRKLKGQFSSDELHEMSDKVCKSILSDILWQESKTVLLYHSLSDEIDTSCLLVSALQEDKKVLLPVVCGEVLELREYSGKTKMGAYGIEEPVGPLFSSYDQIELAIIPGMAFDKSYHRLGRGKGYYDRLLPLLSNAYKLGICFPFQMVEEIPIEKHDVLMDNVVCQ